MDTVLSWAIKENDFGIGPKDRVDEPALRGQEKIRWVNAAGWQNTVNQSLGSDLQ